MRLPQRSKFGRSSPFVRIAPVLFFKAAICLIPAGTSSAAEPDAANPIRLHHVVIPVTDVRAAVAWYAEHAGAAPSTHLHRRAVAFPNGTAIVFEPRVTIDQKSERVREVGVFISASSDGAQSTPQRIEDPWGTTLALYPSSQPPGLAHTVLRTPDFIAVAATLAVISRNDVSAVAHMPERRGFLAGSGWIVLEESSTDTTLAPMRLGFSVDDLAVISADVIKAGTTNPVGPARFESIHVFEATVASGIRMEFTQLPPVPEE